MKLTTPLDTYRLEIGALSDVGRERSSNQDNIGYVHFNDKRNVLALVADGMGGYQGGEIASLTAVQTAQQWFCSHLNNYDIPGILRESFKEANATIYRVAQHTPQLKGMGTTLVALTIINGLVYYANTGDSRLYRFRQGRYDRLTQDHTLVNYWLTKGMLTAEAASHHPERHLLTQAIGTKIDIEIDICHDPLPIEIGDSFLLCSDGLYDLVKDHEINRLVSNNTAQIACNQLVELANSYGGYDNISVVIIKILTTPTRTPKLPTTRI